MSMTGMYIVDFAYLLEWYGGNAGSYNVAWNKYLDINNKESYLLDTYYDVNRYIVVGTFTHYKVKCYDSYEYIANDGKVGQIIKILPNITWRTIKGTSLQDEIHIANNCWIGNVDAGAGNDIIYVGSHRGEGYINGGAGNDTFYFNEFDYTTYSDTINLTGGKGADAYILDETYLDKSNDSTRILDFNIAEDKLVIKKPLKSLSVTLESFGDTIDQYARVIFNDSLSISFEGLSLSEAKNITIESGNTVSTLGALVSQSQLPAGLSFNADKTVLTVNSSYASNILKAADYGTAIKTINAQKAGKSLYIEGNANGNTILAGSKGGTIHGNGGQDSIVGGAGSDYLYGDAGNDTLKGGAGNDFLVGCQGNDILYGGTGNDTFAYARGDGNDTIADFEAGKDQIRYSSGSLSQVKIVNKDVYLYNGSGYQKLTGKAVKGQFADIKGADGWSIVRHNFGTNAIANKWSYVSGQGYHGSSKVDTLVVTGGASRKINLGTASLYTSIENVDASAATGIVTFTGTSAANALYGGKKNDVLKAGAGNDTVKGNAGHDKLYGEAGNDVLYGGAGNDTLYGGAGNDIFFYSRGDGNDNIGDFEKGKDKIRYTSGSLSKVNIAGKDVYLYNGSGYQKLTGRAVKGQYADIVGTNGKSVRHNFGKNAAANSWEYVVGQGYHGSSKTDTLTITGKKSYTINLSDTSLYTSIDKLNAAKAKGDLAVMGSSKADTIIGGSGDDMLVGGAGNDNLQGGSGDDELYSPSGNNILYGGAGSDYLKGGTGTDTLRGGTGNDVIKCGKGVDKIQFYKGDGKDSIIGANKNDILYLYNISNIKTQAKFMLSGHDLVMSFTNNKNDSITLNNWSTSGMNKFVVGSKTYSLKVSGSRISVK